ncbi:hypothetical protein AB0941_16360 [Streptomyces sp. NPDC013433]|uniref:hypothetical protein n=1 Tax=Streptomyces sp. NPDC013433 TaxID=3155604 RepID=UPI003451AAC7
MRRVACLPGQQELPQDDELLPHDEEPPHDEELPQDEEPLPQDDEPPLEQPLDEPPPVPVSHQDEWAKEPPAPCADVPPCGSVPAPEPSAVARVPRSSQARRHARRAIQVTTVTSASTHPPTPTNTISMTSPFRRARAPTARRMPRVPVTRSGL